MRLAVGAGIGAGVGAGVGALVASVTQPAHPRTNKGVTIPPPAPPLVPPEVDKAMGQLLSMFRGANRSHLVECVHRLCHLRAEVMNPQWVPDILVQAEAYHLRRDCVHAISDLMNKYMPDNSTDLFVRNAVQNKNHLIQVLTLAVNEVVNVSREQYLRAKASRGQASP